MSSFNETQNLSEKQASKVTVRPLPDAPIFPEDESLINCSVCAKLTPPSESRLCDDCSADLSASDLTTLNDRLIAEEDSVFDQALRIASGEDRLTLPTRAHLKALVDAMQRHENYTKALECCIAQAQRNADRATEGLHSAAMLYAESEAIH